MEKKITRIRAMMQEQVKAIRERKTMQPSNTEKKTILQPRLKELVEKAKLTRKGNKGTKTVPVSLREKMLSRIEEIKKQQLNKKEVSHD